jgi:hypothetical protein
MTDEHTWDGPTPTAARDEDGELLDPLPATLWSDTERVRDEDDGSDYGHPGDELRDRREERLR